jgi:hypothetical protein
MVIKDRIGHRLGIVAQVFDGGAPLFPISACRADEASQGFSAEVFQVFASHAFCRQATTYGGEQFGSDR